MYQKLIETDSAEKLPIPQDAWLLFQASNHELIRIDLQPGEEIEKHPNEWRIIFYVLEGTGLISIDKKEIQLIAHQTVAIEAGLIRSWVNNGDHVLKLLVIKTRE